MSFAKSYIEETKLILDQLDYKEIDKMATLLSSLKSKGRLFTIGVGGSSATATHAVNDFRKICGIESYCLTDNVAELTARTNDDGWESVFVNYLRTSYLSSSDALLIFSVGGGNLEKNISPNIVKAVEYATHKDALVLGVVGKDGGYTKQNSDACVVIPPMFSDKITPHTEGLAGVILHLLVSHPLLKATETKWESTK